MALSTLLLLALGCAPEATIIDGTIAGFDISEPQTAFFGGRYVVFATEALDCMDVDWVHHTYAAGDDPVGQDLVALQFTFANQDEVSVGHFNISGAAQVKGSGLVRKAGAFTEYRGSEGTLIVDEAEEKGWSTGTFEIILKEDAGTLSGTWSAEWCINL